jgi:hypothetical protein
MKKLISSELISLKQWMYWKHTAKEFAVSSFGVFFLVFVGSLMAGLFIQWLVLPALPSLHAGHGLMAGGDWIRFNQEAVKLAELMRHQGWHAWELRPQGNAPIGIAAAVYFLVGINEPWVLLPLNTAMFALAAVFLHGIFTSFAAKNLAFMAILPFVLFPSAAMIYGQIHKDVFSIAGILVIVFVWVRFALPGASGWRRVFVRVVFIAAGCLLVWVVRPYLLPILLAASILAVLLLASMTGKKRGAAWWWGILLCLLVQVGYNKLPVTPDAFIASGTSGTSGSAMSYLDKMIAELNAERVGFAQDYPHAGSNVDTYVRFNSVADVLSYFPRALQVGLLAPFPSMWLSDGVSPGSNVMRLISGVEMTVSYALLTGVVLLLYGLKDNRPALLVAILMAVMMILVLALTVCNVGTLYRMRYGSLQLLNGLGVLGWGLWWQKWMVARECA